ncbi:MauE/DoxX family redox-associated membrane protein [Chryseobacterium sp. ERMR1:04]|uniref:MauE/DoxX family redox-associated membrane protein n=1 Tax=Chryseobacterium sp. ERMR1:04 TaxID=1705393 RepID=UPI0006C89A10|nr:MauE/DoxX family redox-associated membrane protein [Chryseobacterium sp. ERMR1:04]KPH14757.1 tellurium resistance protein TerC [Chryseobacterium sp. ERMR1:04]
MKNLILKIPNITSYFFILLFCYAAISKIMDFENFQVQIAQSPLLSTYAGLISYSTIIIELIIVIALSFSRTRLLGLYASLFLMAAFTIYIYLILNYSDFIPCSCGGILQNMNWTQHLTFNIICTIVLIVAITLSERKRSMRTSRLISNISLLLILSSGTVVYLFLTSEHMIKKENNFTRRFIPTAVMESKALPLSTDSYYLAGIENEKIYLGDSKAPLILTSVDTTLIRASARKLTLDNTHYQFRNVQLQVQKTYYYLYDGTVPVIYRGRIKDSIAKTISYNEVYFNQFIPLDSTQFAFRTIATKNKQFILAGLKLEKSHQSVVNLYTSILKKQKDGIFDSDGKLLYDRKKSNLIYIHSYRNQIIVMNNDFKVQHQLHTIDTTTIARVKIRKLTNGSYKMVAPPLKVNKSSTVYGGILFNQSNLIGKHESPQTWKRASIIDIYRTDKQEYLGSFYIYNRNDVSISNMMISGSSLYVIIGNELIKYKLNKKITDSYSTGKAENL